MNPAHLLEHFDRISDAPAAIPRLRRFILDLAVRGKLVEHDPEDEPATDLLKRVKVEKARLVKIGRGKKGQPSVALTADELPFQLPMNWYWSQLAETGLINPRNSAADDLPASFVPMPLVSTEYGVSCKYEVKPWGEIKAGFTHFADGDVALAKITPCFQNGKSTIFRGLAGSLGAGTTELHVVRPVLICADYVLIFLKSPYFIESGILRMTGTAGQKRVPTEYFAYSPFPLPPLAEQHRIVAKVNELMRLCDRLEAAQAEREQRRDRLAAASLQRLNEPDDAAALHENANFHLRHLARLTARPDQIPALREAILDLAVRGHLIPQNPNDEPASELVERIRLETVRLGKRKLASLQPPLTITAEEIPSAVPDSWQWVRLGDVLLGNSQNGYSKKPDDALDGIPILRISAGTVRRDGIVAEEEHKLIGGVSAALREQYELRPGDLLACRFNGNRSFVGRLSLYLGYLGLKPIYPDKLIRLRLFSQFVLPKLVRYFGESRLIRKDVETYCATTVGNWGISASNLKKVKIPLPPLAEQHRIVVKVEELMALCDRLEAQLTTAQTESRRLLEAVLHEALAAS